VAVGPDLRYYVHASTKAAKAHQEYLRDVPRQSSAGWWALILVVTILVGVWAMIR